MQNEYEFRTAEEVQIYNSVKGQWSKTTPMQCSRSSHGIVALSHGRIMIAGGCGRKGQPLRSTEIFSLSPDGNRGGSWTAGPELPDDVSGPLQLAPLPDEKVIAISLNATAVYDPASVKCPWEIIAKTSS